MKRPREWQKEQTRERIVEAARDVLLEAGENAVTIELVAARAAVSERTVFRHFESRHGLLRSVWKLLEDAAVDPAKVETLIRAPGRRFRRWDANEPAVRSRISKRASASSAALAERRRAVLICVWSSLVLLDPAAARRRAAIVDLLSSQQAWEVLGQDWGLSAAEASRAASEALAILLGRLPADL